MKNNEERLDNSEESWQLAHNFAYNFKVLPERLSHVLRVLRKEYATKDEEADISENCYMYMSGIDRFPALKVPLYFAASHLFPVRFKEAEDDTSKAILKVLEPGMFSSLLVIFWFYRRIAKGVDSSLWSEYSKGIMLDMELGYALGESLPGISAADGILLAGVCQIAWGSLLIENSDGYVRYNNLHAGRINLADEHKRFGCDHAQIATSLILGLGMLEWRRGLPRRQLEPLELRDIFLGRGHQNGLEDKWLRTCSKCIFMLDQIKQDKFSMEELEKMGASKHARENLQQSIANYFKGTPTFTWINKGLKEVD